MHTEGVIGWAGSQDAATAYAVGRLRARGWTVVHVEPPDETPHKAHLPLLAIVTSAPATARAWRQAAPVLPVVLIADAETAFETDPRILTLLPPFEVVHIATVLESAFRARPPHPHSMPPRSASRIRLGTEALDAPFGGVLRGRAFAVSGPAGAGKTVLALQYLARGLSRAERGLLLSERSPSEVAHYAQDLHLPLSEAIESGALIVLEYRDFPTIPAAFNAPPPGFAQFVEIVQSNHVRRAVLDPAGLWAPDDQRPTTVMAMSFVRALERTGATTMLTLPNSTSDVARRWAGAIESAAATTIRMTFEPGARRTAEIRDALRGRWETPISFVIEPGIGLRPPRAP